MRRLILYPQAAGNLRLAYIRLAPNLEIEGDAARVLRRVVEIGVVQAVLALLDSVFQQAYK